MKIVFLPAMLVAGSVLAAEPADLSPTDPAAELAKQSGLPLEEISRLLKDCDADQQSMNFCAWRDQTQAEDMIRLSVAHLQTKLPSYHDCISAKAAQTVQHIKRKCTTDAHRDYAGGSVETYQRTQCIASSEAAYARSLERMTSCRSTD